VLDRCEIVEADFFKAVPGGDVYLLKDILHDWDDGDAVRILAACRAAMHTEGRVLIVERVLPEQFDADPAKLNSVMTDLHMMVLFGGRERTPDEYAALFSAAGLRLTRVERGDPFGIVEAVV
jgi:hypothetical protein